MPGELTSVALPIRPKCRFGMNAAYDLSDRHALVTGATHDAGVATALALASAGATVIACHGGDDEAAHILAQQLKESGGDHRVVLADVTDADGLAAAVETCRAQLGTVDIVVHVATAHTTSTPFADLTAAALVAQAARPLLAAGGSVVNIATVASGELGLAGLTRSLARDLGPDAVRVNLVAAAPASRPEDIAAVALFLASTDSGGVNGETVVVDGGE